MQPDSTLTALSAVLEGAGDKSRGALNGEILVNDHRVQLDPLRYATDGETLKIERLTLRTPEAEGTLQLHGAHFNIGTGMLSVLDEESGQFNLLSLDGLQDNLKRAGIG